MPLHSAFQEQVDALDAQLERLQKRLPDLRPEPPGSEQPLSARERERFQDLQTTLASIGKQLRDALQKISNASQAGGSASQFKELATVRADCRSFAADCLAFEQSAAMRHFEPVRSACRLADTFLEELSGAIRDSRSHYVLISDAEHFTGDAKAIHLSYMRLGFWQLARVAHEFGHLWAEKSLRGAQIQSDFAALIPRQAWSEAQAKEFFADVFATYVLGPAYASSCLLLDFNPAEKNVSDTHPNGDARAHCVLFALSKLVQRFEGFSSNQAADLHTNLNSFWTATRNAAGLNGDLINKFDLKHAVDVAFLNLEDNISSARYNSMEKANRVSNLSHDAQATMRDILNGAWLRRNGQAGPQIKRVEREMQSFAAQVIARRSYE